MTDLFTCVTCNIAFNDAEFQREHYKSDWHRYNLKRKVAELSPIDFKDFTKRVQIQKDEQDKVQIDEKTFCKLCSKHFTNANSYSNHKQSKKHKELEIFVLKSKNTLQASTTEVNADDAILKVEEKNQISTDNNDDLITCKSDRSAKKAIQVEEYMKKLAESDKAEAEMEVEINENEEGDHDWEDIADDSILMETGGIDLLTCFFCTHQSQTAEEKCEHMAKEHTFFIPDMDHVSDLEGLLKFLGIKIGVYHVCLWCSSKCYRDLLSVQRHMSDKGHQKMKFEGETLIEYSDFYSFDDDTDEDDTIATEDEYDIVSNRSAMNESRLSKVSTLINDDENDTDEGDSYNDEMYELCLPSGTRIGHRSLFRYYKQSFGHRNLELKARSNITVQDKYRAISNGAAYTQVEVKKQRKDMMHFKRWTAKMDTKLGWKANKLQTHFRRQDICF